jgi:succinyl-diaminopimelate desuccinylase
MTSSTAQLTSDLIRAASVSPNDAGCQALLASRLEAIDFNVEHMPFEDVSNFWAVHGTGAPHLVFAGHTVVDALRQRGTHIDWCVVGEPSSTDVLGDVVRVGRRGSLNGRLSIKGVQGHVAYPDQADNPIHRAMPALAALTKERWDDGNDDFPPTSMQISNIGAGTGVNNVIPGELIADFNFRFSPESTESSLKERTTAILDHYQLNYAMDWRLSGNPFHTRGGELIPAVADSIAHVMNVTTELSTSGGTSDGRFIARAGTEVVELGPCNRTIHKINECVRLTDLELLADIYYHLMVRLLAR